MPVISTKDFTAGNWLKREFWAEYGYCRKEVTIAGAADDVLVTGTVMATGDSGVTYQAADGDAVDATKNAVGIFLGYGTEVEPTMTLNGANDQKAIMLIKGSAIVGSAGLVFAKGTWDAAETAAAHAELEALGINVDESL